MNYITRQEQYKKFDEMFDINCLFKRIVLYGERTFRDNKTGKDDCLQGIMLLSNNMIVPIFTNCRCKLRPLCIYKGKIHAITKTILNDAIIFGDKCSIDSTITKYNHDTLYDFERKYKSHNIAGPGKHDKIYIIDYKIF